MRLAGRPCPRCHHGQMLRRDDVDTQRGVVSDWVCAQCSYSDPATGIQPTQVTSGDEQRRQKGWELDAEGKRLWRNERIYSLGDQGNNATEIAAKLGMSKSAVSKILNDYREGK